MSHLLSRYPSPLVNNSRNHGRRERQERQARIKVDTRVKKETEETGKNKGSHESKKRNGGDRRDRQE